MHAERFPGACRLCPSLPCLVCVRPSCLCWGLQGRQELLRGMTDGDAVLLIGGDLTVTVEQAQGLWGVSKDTHPFARVTVLEPFPTDTGVVGWVGGYGGMVEGM